MEILEMYNPRLVGSVWRGTARQGSDIDISVFSLEPELVLRILKDKHKVFRTEWIFKTNKGETKKYFHIFASSPSGKEVEIVVKNPQYFDKERRCKIYGDVITGLTISRLKELLKKDSLRKFIPNNKLEVI
jgi:predicted nucleotidyltransferase